MGASAAIAPESGPPERHIPTGTSLRIRRRIESRRRSRNASSASGRGASRPGSNDHVSTRRTRPRETTRQVAAGTVRIPAKNVASVPSGWRPSRKRTISASSGSRSSGKTARIAFGSDANAARPPPPAQTSGLIPEPPRPDERLDPEAVAREDEAPLPRVPEAERPHAVEALEAALAPGVVGVED